MKKHFASAAITVVALTAAVLLLQGPADSQAPADGKAPPKGAPKGKGKGKARPTGPTPRMADGKPDFNGIYQWPTYLPGDEKGHSNATTFDRKKFAPLKPGGEPFLEPRTGDPRHDEPRDFCMPAGFPSGILSADAMQFFQTKDYLVMVHEFQRMSRVIPLDGRKHREDLEPTFYGDPVGHWEGDTLVIETTGFKRWRPAPKDLADSALIFALTALAVCGRAETGEGVHRAAPVYGDNPFGE